ncbi:MAG TPA: ATP-binding protein [Deltaproteobacteria bacterium]|mgnify:CR=1 FL=1|nr:ATP-binding protein [Deltaproteobacteria bacterium]HOI06105.1 ATP-binding protein [Deltaproteobacteria bacterium]
MPRKTLHDVPLRSSDGPEDRQASRRDAACSNCRDWELIEKTEQRFRDLVENSPTGICIVQDEQVVYRNPEQQRIFGPLEEGLYPSIYERIHPEDWEKLRGLIQSTLSGHAPQAGIDFRFIRLSGETMGELAMKWLHCRSSLIEHRGRPAVLINMLDVTKAREMERLLNIQARMSSLGHVAAGIAHEIRNHLSVINIYVDAAEQALETGGDRGELEEVFGRITEASGKIVSIILRVMDFSKASGPHLKRIDINKPIEDALMLSSVMLRKTGIEIIKNLVDDPPSCLADSQLIEQVILNLVTNAAESMKAMEQGKKIRVTSAPNGGNTVVVSVADSGPGVPSNLAQRIFDPFFTTKVSSTGIGLSLCQRIINDHGGVLSISPSELGGAEFSFTLPVSP